MSVAAPPIAPASASRLRAAPAPFARVEVFGAPAAALEAWRELAAPRRGSFYQSEAFLLAWLDAFAISEKVSPFFVVARDSAGAPLTFLPLGLFRFGPLRLAQFLGGKHSNYNLGLFRPDFRPTGPELRRLLREAARAAPVAPHLYRLLNLPLVWRGAVNPLTMLPTHPAASRAWSTRFQDDGEALLAARLSADTRKKSRKKEKRLAAMGALRYARAAGAEESQKALDAYFRHKKVRPELPRDADDLAALQTFYRALAANGLELHILSLDEKIIAVLGAGAQGGRLQGLFISYESDPGIAKSSPGEILLTHVLRDACARKFDAFDLGVGDARYKTTFCDEAEQLAEAFYAPTAIGRAALPFFALAAALKRAIKRHPHLLALTKKWRRRGSRADVAGE